MATTNGSASKAVQNGSLYEEDSDDDPSMHTLLIDEPLNPILLVHFCSNSPLLISVTHETCAIHSTSLVRLSCFSFKDKSRPTSICEISDAYIAVSFFSGVVLSINLQTLEQRRIAKFTSPVWFLALNEDILYISMDDGLHVIQNMDPTKNHASTLLHAVPRPLCISVGQDAIFFGTAGGKVLEYDLKLERVKRSIDLDGSPVIHGIVSVVLPDMGLGKYEAIITADSSGKITVIRQMQLMQSLKVMDLPLLCIKQHVSTNTRIFCSGFDSKLSLCSFDKLSQRFVLTGFARPCQVDLKSITVMTPTGNVIAAGSDGKIYTHDLRMFPKGKIQHYNFLHKLVSVSKVLRRKYIVFGVVYQNSVKIFRQTIQEDEWSRDLLVQFELKHFITDLSISADATLVSVITAGEVRLFRLNPYFSPFDKELALVKLNANLIDMSCVKSTDEGLICISRNRVLTTYGLIKDSLKETASCDLSKFNGPLEPASFVSQLGVDNGRIVILTSSHKLILFDKRLQKVRQFQLEKTKSFFQTKSNVFVLFERNSVRKYRFGKDTDKLVVDPKMLPAPVRNLVSVHSMCAVDQGYILVGGRWTVLVSKDGNVQVDRGDLIVHLAVDGEQVTTVKLERRRLKVPKRKKFGEKARQ